MVDQVYREVWLIVIGNSYRAERPLYDGMCECEGLWVGE